ncbi:MAG TPA: hypothetical protein VFS95_15490, partial [Telluria sp.]|nr:hypothetical protein [Telluria sp.]
NGIGIVFLLAWLGLALSDFLPVDFASAFTRTSGGAEPHFRAVPVAGPAWFDHVLDLLPFAGAVFVLAGVLVRRRSR